MSEVAAAVITVALLPLFLHLDGIFGAAIVSFLAYSAIAIYGAFAISRKTGQRVTELVVPTRHLMRMILARVSSFIPKRIRPA
jgi:apolipoprotein N-acyltransferase